MSNEVQSREPIFAIIYKDAFDLWKIKEKDENGKEKPILTPAAFLVYFALKLRASSADGSCFPSLNTITDDTGLSRDTVIQSIKALEKAGLIKVYKRRKNDRQTSNLYVIHNVTKVGNSDKAGSEKSDSGWSEKHDSGWSEKPDPNYNHINKNQEEPDSGSVSDETSSFLSSGDDESADSILEAPIDDGETGSMAEKPKRKPNPAYEIYSAFLQANGLDGDTANKEAMLRRGKELAALGFTADDVFMCINWIHQWGEKYQYADLNLVKRHIDRWRSEAGSDPGHIVRRDRNPGGDESPGAESNDSPPGESPWDTMYQNMLREAGYDGGK